jgi:hypothetical protein
MINQEVYKYIPGLHPFIDYIFEDKTHYTSATSKNYTDLDDDFLVGDSGGFLMKIDFIFVNTYHFTQAARKFQLSGKNDSVRFYNNDKPDTIGYKMFWKQETMRRRVGMTAPCKLYRKDINAYNLCTTDEERLSFLHPLHITGDHYNYLNYGRIQRTPTKIEREELNKAGKFKQKRIDGFPRFWDGDYWNFKIDEFIARNNYHLCKGKSRRKGYSHKRGSQGANTMNLNPSTTIVLAAWDITFLTKPGATSDMLKKCLDWYENHTFWRRGYLSEDLTAIELGYKLSKTGNKKYGFRSSGISVTCKDNPNAVVGKGAVEIDFEESGVFPNLQETVNVTLSSTESGDESVGTIRAYGTGGTKGANWLPFSNMFFHPEINNMMPFENIWDKGLRHNTCGFFHPQMWDFEPHMDINGNSYLVESYNIDIEDKIAKRRHLTSEDYSVYCSQRANSPSEAFNISTENIFSSTELDEHVKFIRANQSTILYREGQFENVVTKKANGEIERSTVEFKTNDELYKRGDKVHSYLMNVPFRKEDDVYGCWRIFHEPKRFDGLIPNNLYYEVIDTVGKDKTIKEVNTKNSLNAIYVLSYPNDLGVPEGIQAIYVGRRDDSQTDCSIEALKGVEYYNAKALPETDRGTVVADFKVWHKVNRLIKNPLAVVNNRVMEGGVNEYGVYIGEGDNAVTGIIQLKQWLYTIINVNEDGSYVYRLHYIPDLPTLLELQQYNSKGNFDRISALRLLTFERLAYIAKKKKPTYQQGQGTFLSSIGLYKN